MNFDRSGVNNYRYVLQQGKPFGIIEGVRKEIYKVEYY
jgi:hypothetical protein